MKDRAVHVVAIIPARGGSKGLPRKNILPLLGKPLLAWSIEAARNCSLIDRVVVSTDDEEIRDVAIAWNGEVPFLRPPELASDTAPNNPVLKHCVEELERLDGRKVDIIVYLQPTDLFRKQWMLEQVIRHLLEDPELDTAFVAYPSHKNFWVLDNGTPRRMTPFNELGRQEKVPIFREDTGIACATRRHVVLAGRRIGDNVAIVPNEDEFSAIDIHHDIDLKHAEAVLRIAGVTIND